MGAGAWPQECGGSRLREEGGAPLLPGPPRVGLPLRVVEVGVGDEQASLLKVVQRVVLPVRLEVPGQGLLLLAELGGHLLVHVREEQARAGLRLPLCLLKGLHNLGEVGDSRHAAGPQPRTCGTPARVPIWAQRRGWAGVRGSTWSGPPARPLVTRTVWHCTKCRDWWGGTRQQPFRREETEAQKEGPSPGQLFPQGALPQLQAEESGTLTAHGLRHLPLAQPPTRIPACPCRGRRTQLGPGKGACPGSLALRAAVRPCWAMPRSPSSVCPQSFQAFPPHTVRDHAPWGMAFQQREAPTFLRDCFLQAFSCSSSHQPLLCR